MSHASTRATLVVVVLSSACTSLPVRSDGRHVAGVFRATFSSGEDLPKNVYYDPNTIDRIEATGVLASYALRVRDWRKTTSRDSTHIWFGPEVTAGWCSGTTTAASGATVSAGVSQTVVMALARIRLYGTTRTATPSANFWSRFEVGGSGGLAYVRFTEDGVRRDGTPIANPVTNPELGPAAGFSFGFWISEEAVIRLDGTFLFLSPQLSFPWPGGKRVHGLAGIGLVIVK